MASDNDPGQGIRRAVYGYIAVGSRSEDGTPDVMTATWGMQVSFEPRVYAVAIQEDSHTAANVGATGAFSVNFMPGGTHDLALKLATHSTSGAGRLEGEEISYFETDTPVLGRAVGWIECRVVDSARPGDHTVFFGEVVGGGEGPSEGEAAPLATIDLSYAG
jgi:flavin reductase (DIM6/NTAB) family NADH-FMN oxidoreductase RutF